MFSPAAVKRSLLQLEKDKRKFGGRLRLQMKSFRSTLLSVSCISSEGTSVIGAPVGSVYYRWSFTDSRVIYVAPTFDNVARLEDGHVALALLRACLCSSLFMNL